MDEKFPTDRGPAVGGFVYPLQLLGEVFSRQGAPPETLVRWPTVRRIHLAELREALNHGYADFTAHRTDVMFLCLLYPVLGLALFHATIGHGLLPLLFPLAAGFALIGPLAGTGLYEMSRRMEAGEDVSWRTVFRVLQSPGFGGVLVLGLFLAAWFIIWLQVALAIYEAFLGTAVPASVSAFLHDVFDTSAGWRMIVVGNVVGFVFAIVSFVVGVISFPMLIDGRFGRTSGERLTLAVATSLRAVAVNPGPMAVWGLIVAASLILGSLPFFLGLVVALPVLSHATWHLYRRVVS